MENDNSLRVSYVLSLGIHASVFLLFTFVIVLDFGSVIRPLEVMYVGHAGRQITEEDRAKEKTELEPPPPVDLPDRDYAIESVSSKNVEKTSMLPDIAGKLSFEENKMKGLQENRISDRFKSRIEPDKVVKLSAHERYAVEGDLSERKIIIRPPAPDYPEWAVKRGVEANVKFRVTVNPDGIVEDVQSLESTGYRRMDLIASKYLKQWRFESRAFDTESETGIISVKFRLK